MTATPNKVLPEFQRPPIVEVAASLQFERLDGLDAPRLGLLWNEYRNRFPRAEQHPPIAVAKETFGPPRVSEVEFSINEALQTPRLWFLNEIGTRLIQVQSSRFVVNWRKLDTEEDYPRYTSIRESMTSELEVFSRYLKRENLGEIRPNQVELTYVNHFFADSAGPRRVPVQEYVRLWAGEPKESHLPSSEDVNFQTRYPISEDDTPVGRLYIKLESRFRISDRKPLYSLNLMVRRHPTDETLSGVWELFDKAHEQIVTTFAEITTAPKHKEWGRIQ